MKNLKSILPVVVILALITLSGCIVYSQPLAPTQTPWIITAPSPTRLPPPPTEPPKPDEPQFSFIADRTSLILGECTTLRWNIEGQGEFGLALFGGTFSGQPVGRSGQQQVCPTQSTSYNLGVNTGTRVIYREVVIFVAGVPQPQPPSAPTATTAPPPPPACPGPPVIASFTANPSTITAGQQSTLSWGKVDNATSAVIDQGIGGVATPGSTTVKPAQTTTYTLTATGCGGTTTKQVTVNVTGGLPVVTILPITITAFILSDLAVTDIYADQQWKVYIKIKNNGPSNLTNATAGLSCTIGTTHVGGVQTKYSSARPISINLQVGQESSFEIGETLHAVGYHDIMCSVKAQSPVSDTVGSNDSYTKRITRGP